MENSPERTYIDIGTSNALFCTRYSWIASFPEKRKWIDLHEISSMEILYNLCYSSIQFSFGDGIQNLDANLFHWQGVIDLEMTEQKNCDSQPYNFDNLRTLKTSCLKQQLPHDYLQNQNLKNEPIHQKTVSCKN